MSVGFEFALTGAAAASFEDGHEAILSWARAFAPDLLEGVSAEPHEQGGGLVLVSLHPAAPPLFVRLGARAAVAAETGSAGPGYHAFVIDALKKLPEVGLEMVGGEGLRGDPTGYAEGAPFASVVTACATWLAAEAAPLVEAGAGSLALLPGHRYETVSAAPFNTPLGRRGLPWLEAVARDGHAGLDALPWRGLGRDAAFHRDRALSQLWCGVRFRAPGTELELERLESVVDDLEHAHEAAPEMALPTRAWAELAGFAGRELPPAGAVAMDASQPVGYRRDEVLVEAQDGWWLTVPGQLSEDEREGAFWAGDTERGVWLAAFRPEDATADPAALARAALQDEPLGELFEDDEGGVHKVANLVSDPDSEGQLLHYACAVDGALAVGMFAFGGPEGRAWAVRTLLAMRHE